MYQDQYQRASEMGSLSGIGGRVASDVGYPTMAQAMSGLASGIPAPTPRDRGQIEVVSDGVAEEVSKLSAMLEQLEIRLSPVLQQELPQTVGNDINKEPSIPASPAVCYLLVQRRRIEQLQYRVDRLMSRLDT